jgi:hypothetical protein
MTNMQKIILVVLFAIYILLAVKNIKKRRVYNLGATGAHINFWVEKLGKEFCGPLA